MSKMLILKLLTSCGDNTRRVDVYTYVFKLFKFKFKFKFIKSRRTKVAINTAITVTKHDTLK